MMMHLPGVLTAEEAARIREALAAERFVDGKATAAGYSAEVKRNVQVDPSQATKALGEQIAAALGRHPRFAEAFLPKRIRPPLFSRYEPGMTYGEHVDAPVLGTIGTAAMMRSDISITVFLADPESYEGGELVINTLNGEITVKLAAGDGFAYPAQTLHRVAPVTAGVREVAVTWAESYVRDESRRELLYEMTRLSGLLHTGEDPAEARKMAMLVLAKMRRWWWDT